jgi:N-glycosylase/DNA lyase
LFTADLRSFSERLTSKVEVKIKQEDDTVPVESQVASAFTVATKRPPDDDIDTKKEELVVEAAETTVTRRRSKRRRT